MPNQLVDGTMLALQVGAMAVVMAECTRESVYIYPGFNLLRKILFNNLKKIIDMKTLIQHF